MQRFLPEIRTVVTNSLEMSRSVQFCVFRFVFLFRFWRFFFQREQLANQVPRSRAGIRRILRPLERSPPDMFSYLNAEAER